MRAWLESTDKIVMLETASGEVPARIWEGLTEGGVELIAFVTRVAVFADVDQREFERDLRETRALSPAAEAIPLRLIL